MSLSSEERAKLAAIETVLCEQDPELARTLATFTRPQRSRRWLWGVLLVPLGAVLVGVLLATAVVLSGGAF